MLMNPVKDTGEQFSCNFSVYLILFQNESLKKEWRLIFFFFETDFVTGKK